jgi:4-hydroxy-tetrahydrodipicolinate reductase
MIKVGVSGAAGRMGTLTCRAVESASDMELSGSYAPGHGFDDPEALSPCEVVVEFTRPEVVMGNLTIWRRMGLHTVVGTSGLNEALMAELSENWGQGSPNCLVVPNFSVGATLMMRFAEQAALHFTAAEVVELHHDRKADAPSGTAIATAARIKPVGRRAVESAEVMQGARGAGDEVKVHSVRLPGMLAHQEVLLGRAGEVLTIRHDVTDRSAYVPGILLAIRSVAGLRGVTVGLETLLGL